MQQLLDHLGKEAPKLVEDLVPKLMSLSTLQKVLQNLLAEGVHIRDMRTIIETLAEHALRTQDPNELTALVRVALGRAIVQQLFPGDQRTVGDDARQPPRAPADAGAAGQRPGRRRHRAGAGRYHRRSRPSRPRASRSRWG